MRNLWLSVPVGLMLSSFLRIVIFSTLNLVHQRWLAGFVFFGYVLLFGGLDSNEKKRVLLIGLSLHFLPHPDEQRALARKSLCESVAVQCCCPCRSCFNSSFFAAS